MADAFHQIAVRGDDESAVIDQITAEPTVQNTFRQRKADRMSKTLPQGARRHFHADVNIGFGVARGVAAQLAEILDLVDGHFLVARQIGERVKQHRPVSGGKNKTVTIRP